MKRFLFLPAVAAAAAVAFAAPGARTIVETDAYRWQGDTLYQDEFKAWAVSPYEIRSTYKGRPHYFMPVEQTWKRKNDLSAYPRLTTPNRLHQAVFNMGLDEMVNAVEPDTTLRTGKEWAGVWTRDVSYSIILSMAVLQPEASMISLMKKVNPSGQIIQDTGSGGAWPVSTDRMVWVLAAWEIYKVTGSREWLEKVYPIAVRSIAKDDATVRSERGLVKGETSFIDWREQSYPRWMQTADISQSEAMGTNVMYAAALKAVGEMARILGHKAEAESYFKESAKLAEAIDRTFYVDRLGLWGMYTYGRDAMIVNPRAETLGLALSILYDIAPEKRQKQFSENNPTTPYGPAIFFPQIADMPSYHNNALWPFVASYWTLAQAKAGNEDGVVEGIGSVVRPAALFATNKENFNLDNGDYFTELNSSNMLWSLSGNLALTMKILFGLHYEADGLLIKPFVPEAFRGERSLDNISYRGATLNITVRGYGCNVASMTLNGKPLAPGELIPAKKLRGTCDIVVEMDNKPIPVMGIRATANKKAPLTPVAWLEDGNLVWNPIEYIAEYVVLQDGHEVGHTRRTSWPVGRQSGVWQVYGVSAEGIPGFASEPRSTRRRARFEFSGEGDAMESPEISYPARESLDGSHRGFVEIDRTSAPAKAVIRVDAPGEYTLAFRYANGNGPVNTENKCCVRAVFVDGVKAGTAVMPTRGEANWPDWGMSNTVRLPLSAGEHTVELRYLPEDENMNISTNHALVDCVVVEHAL